MASEIDFLRLALLAYEAASEPEVWPRFLEAYAKAFPAADFAVIQTHDLGRHKSKLISSFGVSVPFAQSYCDYYSTINIWRDRGRAYYRRGKVNLTQELCTRLELESSEFYNDYILRIRGPFGIAAVLAREGDSATTLSVHAQQPFDESQREIVRLVMPHLSRAWGIHQRMATLSAGESVLDALPLGVVLLAEGGGAVYWNRAAEEIFRANDGLSLRNGMLAAVERSADAQLRTAIGDALSPRLPAGPAAVPVPRPSLQRDYQVVAAPLRGRLQQFAGAPTPKAVVLITDPARQRPAASELLIQIYRLTPKEAMLAAKLSEGKSVKQAAAELAISYETARTHLRRVFEKTGTSRQGELLLLMSRLPGSG